MTNRFPTTRMETVHVTVEVDRDDEHALERLKGGLLGAAEAEGKVYRLWAGDSKDMPDLAALERQMHGTPSGRRAGLLRFITESNRIERIMRPPTIQEIRAHEAFLDLPVILTGDLERFVQAVAAAPMRDVPGRDVHIVTGDGIFKPQRGGPGVREALLALLRDLDASMNVGHPSPYHFHNAYEKLHPFMDGNGRSGRALWAWHHLQLGAHDPFLRGFLHQWYYESLSDFRGGA